MKFFKQKELDASKLFYCRIRKATDGIVYTEKTVVYQVGEIYYDMRRINWAWELSKKPHGDQLLYYKKDESTMPTFYDNVQCDIIEDSLELFYKDGRKTFTINEVINDMVEDNELDTDWPGFSTEQAAKAKKLEMKKSFI